MDITIDEIMNLAEDLNDLLADDGSIYLEYGDNDTDQQRQDLNNVWNLAWDRIFNDALTKTSSKFITFEDSSNDDCFGYVGINGCDSLQEDDAEELIEYFEEQGYESISQVKKFFALQEEIAQELIDNIQSVITEVCDKYNEEHNATLPFGSN